MPNSTTSEGSSASSSVSSSRSNAHMPRVTLRTVEPAKLLACQSVEKRCTRWNASRGDVAHDAERERHHRPPGEVAQRDHRERRAPIIARKAASAPSRPAGAERQRVDQPAGEDRHEDLGQRRERHRRGQQDGLPLAARPVAGGEAEDGAQDGVRAARLRLDRHRIIARGKARVPTEISVEARKPGSGPGGPRGDSA